jgi:hypothetical protein
MTSKRDNIDIIKERAVIINKFYNHDVFLLEEERADLMKRWLALDQELRDWSPPPSAPTRPPTPEPVPVPVKYRNFFVDLGMTIIGLIISVTLAAFWLNPA